MLISNRATFHAADALIGFSVGLQMSWEFDRQPVGKIPASLDIFLYGAANIVGLILKKTFDKKVAVIGAVGKDDIFNNLLYHFMRQNGISPYLLPMKPKGTPDAYAVFYQDRNKPLVLVHKKPIVKFNIDRIRKIIQQTKPSVRIITGLAETSEYLRLAPTLFKDSQSGRIINIDPALAKRRRVFDEVVGFADLIIMNEEEGRQLFRDSISSDKLNKIHKLGPQFIIVTKSEKGSLLSIKDQGIIKQKAYQCGKIIDTTGAGDAFLAGFVSAYFLDHRSVKDALAIAALTAGIKVTKTGSKFYPTGAEFKYWSKKFGIALK